MSYIQASPGLVELEGVRLSQVTCPAQSKRYPTVRVMTRSMERSNHRWDEVMSEQHLAVFAAYVDVEIEAILTTIFSVLPQILHHSNYCTNIISVRRKEEAAKHKQTCTVTLAAHTRQLPDR